jgi:hypothetical protein
LKHALNRLADAARGFAEEGSSRIDNFLLGKAVRIGLFGRWFRTL